MRRDQLNYQIEKNLLKETYSSNFQTINIVLTIVLSAFSILGYLGLKNVGSLREAFDKELQEYRGMKKELELDLKNLKAEQTLAKTQVEKLAAKNEEQDRRLKALEIQEKVISLMKEGQHNLALDYLKVGLILTPDNVMLHKFQADCLGIVGRFTDAIESYICILKLDPQMSPAILNLAELYALTGPSDELDLHMKTHQGILERRAKFSLMWYLTAINLFMKGDLKSLIAHVPKLLEKVPAGKNAPLLGKWRDEEVLRVLSDRAALPGAQLMLSIVSFFKGEIDKAVLEAALVSAKT